MEPSVMLGAVTLIGSVGIWALRTEGRVNGHDLLFKEREKREDQRDQRLERIENKLDEWFNSHKGNGG